MAYSARYNQSAKTYAVFSDSGGFVDIDDVVKMLNERDELLTLLKEIYTMMLFREQSQIMTMGGTNMPAQPSQKRKVNNEH